jgi:uncharacterized repeat protein (TIGR03803 family)
MNTNGTDFKSLYDFTAGSGVNFTTTNSDGANPFGVIVLGNTLYGATSTGGSGGNGTVFSLSPLPATLPRIGLTASATNSF